MYLRKFKSKLVDSSGNILNGSCVITKLGNHVVGTDKLEDGRTFYFSATLDDNSKLTGFTQDRSGTSAIGAISLESKENFCSLVGKIALIHNDFEVSENDYELTEV